MADRSEARRRRWADVLVLIIGVYQFVLALFGYGLAGPGGMAWGVTRIGWVTVAAAVSGTLAIAAVLTAVKNTLLARILTALSGLMLLSALFGFAGLGTRVWLFVIVPAALLLLATPFIGPMPTPEEEGRRR